MVNSVPVTQILCPESDDENTHAPDEKTKNNHDQEEQKKLLSFPVSSASRVRECSGYVDHSGSINPSDESLYPNCRTLNLSLNPVVSPVMMPARSGGDHEKEVEARRYTRWAGTFSLCIVS